MRYFLGEEPFELHQNVRYTFWYDLVCATQKSPTFGYIPYKTQLFFFVVSSSLGVSFRVFFVFLVSHFGGGVLWLR